MGLRPELVLLAPPFLTNLAELFDPTIYFWIILKKIFAIKAVVKEVEKRKTLALIFEEIIQSHKNVFATRFCPAIEWTRNKEITLNQFVIEGY